MDLKITKLCLAGGLSEIKSSNLDPGEKKYIPARKFGLRVSSGPWSKKENEKWLSLLLSKKLQVDAGCFCNTVVPKLNPNGVQR